MIKKIALAATVAATALTATPAMAAAPTASATATVRLYSALTLKATQASMDFGAVVRESTYTGGSAIVLDASTGSVDCSASALLVCSGATKASAFTINGDNGANVEIKVSGTDYNKTTNVLKLKNGTFELPLTLSVSGLTGIATTTDLDDYSIGTNGSDQAFKMGGSLVIPANSPTAPNGTYSGSYTLTANYL